MRPAPHSQGMTKGVWGSDAATMHAAIAAVTMTRVEE